MAKNQQRILSKEKYGPDSFMNQLFTCNQDVKCINQCLKHYGSVDLTLEEIGLILGVTKERVRQIEVSALKKLRHPKLGRILREYV